MAPVNHKVVVYGYDEMEEHEDLAAVEVTAGDLLERVPDGGDAAVQPHSSDNALARPFYVALDKRRTGEELGDSYAAGELVFYAQPHGGSVHLRLADGETVDYGDKLVSAGDGTVRAYVAGTDSPEAVVAEAVEGEANSSGSPVYLPVRTAV